MKPAEVYAAKGMLERVDELNGYLRKIGKAETIKIEIEPTFILELTTTAAQDLIDRICIQYRDEITKLEAELEHLGVTPD